CRRCGKSARRSAVGGAEHRRRRRGREAGRVDPNFNRSNRMIECRLMNFLSTIINQKRRRVETAKLSVSPEVLQVMARKARESAVPHALAAALGDESRINIIAEFKRKSPSKGVIRD